MIIALVSRKGGVGKTTTAVSLAAALARRGQQTLLVDLDSQGSASLSLGVPRGQFAPSAADILLNNVSADQAIRDTQLRGLDLITASADLASVDDRLSLVRNSHQVLGERLQNIRDRYDFIFLDCPPTLSFLSRNALVAADQFIIPVTPHYLATEGIQNLIGAAERLRFSNETRLSLMGILLTMVDYRTKLTRESVDRLRRAYRQQVFGIEIRVNVRLAEAPSYGQTIFEYEPASTGAIAYSLLAEELLLRAPSASLQALEKGIAPQ